MKTAERCIFICEYCRYETEDRPYIHGLYEDYYDNVCPRCGEDLTACRSCCAVCNKIKSDDELSNNEGLCNFCAHRLTKSFDSIYDALNKEQQDCLLEYINRRYWQ